MSKDDDGGPAFPIVQEGYFGMSLRDYFAAQFMEQAQRLSEDSHGGWGFDNCADCCYQMADAMIKARSQ